MLKMDPVVSRRVSTEPLLGKKGQSRKRTIQVIKNFLLTIILIAAVIVVILLASSVFLMPSDNLLEDSQGILKLDEEQGSVSTGKTLNISGRRTKHKDFDLIHEATKDMDVEELIAKYVNLDSADFTEALNSKRFQRMKRIILERVNLISQEQHWNFHRVNLPFLEEFVLDLNIGFHDQFTDYVKDITEEGLLNVLFYNKNSTDFNDALDLGSKLVSDEVQVTLRFDGWTVISMKKSETDSGSWEVVLGVEFSEQLLKIFQERELKISQLSVTECSLSIDSLPTSLQYLNLYHVNFPDGEIEEYFSSLGSESILTELFIEIRNATLKISSFPSTIKTLSIGDITNALYQPGDSLPNIETLGLSFPLDPNIIENFDKVFPNVRSVGVFEPPNGSQYILLNNILKTNATWILFDGFPRKSRNENKTQIEEQMENVLENCGVAEDVKSFVLFKDLRTFSWYEKDLDKEAVLKFRYKMLGWKEFISWDVFASNF